MLTSRDTPTIRFALMRRLHEDPKRKRGEKGVRVVDIKFLERDDCIRVGVECEIDHHLSLKAIFDLPLEFEHRHLVNEVDQIAEQCKAARKDWWLRGRPFALPGSVEVPLNGTGLRGLWRQHA